ncbi:MAG: Glu/Leu/Phe/Val dehydrogenase dimerization domain-containing protein [Myxococcota bacterium]
MGRLVELDPQQFAARLLAEGQQRAYLLWDSQAGNYRTSHPLLSDLAELAREPDRGGPPHEAVFLEVGRETETLLAAFVHRSVRGQAMGGLRHWRYPRLADLLRDGLRLSRAMTRKAALAGMWWGGGKGVIARSADGAERDPGYRRAVYREYGAFVSSLRGCYVTAEDAGTDPTDMAEVFRTTRFAVCVPRGAGGSGNPSHMTALGVVCGMEAALDFLGKGTLAGKRIAVQGTGQVGSALIAELFERGVAGVVATEICAERRAALLDGFSGRPLEVRLVEPGTQEILAESCDVLAPCALGGVLGPKTIPSVQAPIVCGAANNPLVDEERDGRGLAERGIAYVPDFVANRMGLVSCANEQYGYVNGDPAVQRHLERSSPNGIYQTALRVLEGARDGGVTPVAAATALADELSNAPHPLWGHRTREIIASLLADRWEDG